MSEPQGQTPDSPPAPPSGASAGSVYCSHCGMKNYENSYRCVRCGELLHAESLPAGAAPPSRAPIPYSPPQGATPFRPAALPAQVYAPDPNRNEWALYAVYLGVLSAIPCLGAPLGLMAVVSGILALAQSSKHPEAPGRGQALIGLMLGAVFGAIYTMLLLLMAFSMLAAANA